MDLRGAESLSAHRRDTKFALAVHILSVLGLCVFWALDRELNFLLAVKEWLIVRIG